MAVVDDPSIPADAVLLRVLLPGWTCLKNARYRPATHAFTDGRTGEVSCFIAGPGVEAEVRRMFPGLEIATVPAGVVRESGFAIERRPGECEGFNGDAGAHVVIGAPLEVTRLEYDRRARRIAVHSQTTILPKTPGREPATEGQ